ncbi:hypothetical protein [Mobiluncus porci]|uniref:Uncharacterized protein n=1 Tax=Mobiluncus porci TaxID=2652278 RepID=A0A7K0K0F4_9ACTO|nr:hypothetical protein [Mobiluncus porci]MST48914.1 hypothetical protein [Mobiluncus porci]
MSEETQLFGQGKPGQMQYEMHLVEARNKIIDAMRIIAEAHYFTDQITNGQELANLQTWTRRSATLNTALMCIDTAQTMQIPKL